MLKDLKELLASVVKNDHVRRVFHTFWQAALGALLAGLVVAKSSHDVKLAVGAAFATGLAAVKALYVANK